jgi:uncharacterized protein YegP (UPF0339 family)
MPNTSPHKVRFEFYVDGAGQHRWRLVARNGRIVADSAEGYSRHADCRKAAKRMVIAIRTPGTIPAGRWSHGAR